MSSVDLVNTLKEALKVHSTKKLAEILNVAPGTIKRWIDLNDVPKAYEFELLKVLNIQIDYSKYTSKEKDQFFTPIDTAKYCYSVFCNKLKELNEDEKTYNYIEPSAGDGSFLKVLPKERTISFDIEPRCKDTKCQDYLTWEHAEGKFVVFGNPPFGLRGNLALRFINHSYKFADYVCFILPQLFESDGKGVPRKRVIGYNLIHSETLKTKFYEPNKNLVDINTIFQIWSKHHKDEEYELTSTTSDIVKVYSLSDGGTSSSTRNKDMLNNCDVYIPSTCFGKENMRYYSSFEELPGRKGYGLVFTPSESSMGKQEYIDKCKEIDWSSIAFLSTNSAYNLRSSQIYKLFSS